MPRSTFLEETCTRTFTREAVLHAKRGIEQRRLIPESRPSEGGLSIKSLWKEAYDAEQVMQYITIIF
jgi:hypothetical protein